MTWQTGTATDHVDLLDKLVKVATGNSASAAAINAAGTGYTLGDILTVSGGTSSYPVTIEVTTVGGGGAVTGVRIQTGGAYTANPSNPVSVTGGTGSSATFNLTMAATGWTALRDTSGGGEREVILRGVGSGSDLIYVGIKTFTALDVTGFQSCKNWSLIGATGFNTGLTFENQPGASPGGNLSLGSGGAYVPLKAADAFPMDFWFSINGRRILGVAKLTNGSVTHYMSWYLGFMNPFATALEQPYPILIAGSSFRYNTFYTDTAPRITGLTEVIGGSTLVGPMFIRDALSNWITIKNSQSNDTNASPARSAYQDYVCYPIGRATSGAVMADTADQITADFGFTWDNFFPQTSFTPTPTWQLAATPNTGGALRLLIPATIQAAVSSNAAIIGELSDVFYVSAIGGVVNNDYITIGADRYRIFQNGNRAIDYSSFMAIREG